MLRYSMVTSAVVLEDMVLVSRTCEKVLILEKCLVDSTDWNASLDSAVQTTHKLAHAVERNIWENCRPNDQSESSSDN